MVTSSAPRAGSSLACASASSVACASGSLAWPSGPVVSASGVVPLASGVVVRLVERILTRFSDEDVGRRAPMPLGFDRAGVV